MSNDHQRCRRGHLAPVMGSGVCRACFNETVEGRRQEREAHRVRREREAKEAREARRTLKGTPATTRAEAIRRGLKRYTSGKPCPSGHTGERWISGACVECKRARAEQKRKDKESQLEASRAELEARGAKIRRP